MPPGMRSEQRDVAVIGAGVSGLTTAVCLAEAGLAVTVYADTEPEQTTSAVAGAIWGPHLVGPDDRVAGWAQCSLAIFRELAAVPAAGVQVMTGTESYRDEQPEPPEWTDGVGERHRCDPAGLPGGFASGWRFTAPVIWMPGYLGYLTARLRRAGGRIRISRTFGSLAQAAAQCDATIMVNCSGAGAHRLVPDPSVTPVRGQTVIAANPGLTEFRIGHAEPPADGVAYFFPHGSRLIMGGTEIHGDWSTQPDPATADQILAGCAELEPRLAAVEVLAHRVGLRPLRPRVRLEAGQTADGRPLLHNYGHGGAGVTLSWGCARELTDLVLTRD
jgi:D-amino-acid oxidase